MSKETNTGISLNDLAELNQNEVKEQLKPYIDPFADFSFKRIFASTTNKDILKSFLNEVMDGHKHIEKIEYNKNEYPGEIKDEGGAILDVVCTDQDGSTFLIEVQSGKQEHFKERALFYASRLISEQAPKGDRKGWAYKLKEVYLIALLEDFSLPDSNVDEYLHNICLINRDTGKIFSNKLGFTYVEMRKFVKTEDELETMLDKWLYALKNLKDLESQPLSLTEPEFAELFSLAKYTNLTREERKMYDASLKARWDNKNVRDYAKKEGREEGLQEGREEGLQEGIQEGIELGAHNRALEIAIQMKQDGEPLAKIVKYSKLTAEEIEKL